MNTLHSIELIYSNPKIRGGRPCIVGTGLRVLDVVMAMHFGSRSPGQIAEDFQITLGQAHAALAYYYENKQDIDDDIREDIRIGRQLAQEGFGKPENSIFPLTLEEMEAPLEETIASVRARFNEKAGKTAELMEAEFDRPENPLLS